MKNLHDFFAKLHDFLSKLGPCYLKVKVETPKSGGDFSILVGVWNGQGIVQKFRVQKFRYLV